MSFNAVGEYLPQIVNSENCTECGLCRRVCPFVDDNSNEDEHGQALYADLNEVKHCSETGYYHECFVGYAPEEEIRWSATSGGMLTWTLCELLERDEVDHVICVRPHSDPDKLFRFEVVSTPQEIREGSRSSYYPVEMSAVVRHMQDNSGRYAVVGLPCVCKAIRNAQLIVPRLKERVRYVFGLACVGQQANANYARAIADIAGLSDPLVCIQFREKQKNIPPENMMFSVRDESGRSASTSFFDGVKELWASGAFRLSGCNYCDDAFAECADAVFMDAWLPEYVKDPGGHNIVLSRDAALSDLFREVKTLKPIAIEQVIKSQAIYAKRNNLRARLFIARCFGWKTPRKRVLPGVPSVKILIKTAVQWSQWSAARKNLAAGKSYNALRIESFPYAAVAWLGRMMRRIRSSI